MATSTKSLEGQPHSPRLLLAAGAVGPLLWTQRANFVVYGALMVCFAIGLKTALRTGKGATWGPILLVAYGLGLIGAGIFITDPGLGYPPGATTPATPSVHGTLHSLFS